MSKPLDGQIEFDALAQHLIEKADKLDRGRQRQIPFDPDAIAAKRLAMLQGWGVPYQEAILLIDRRRSRSLVETQAIRYVDQFLAHADDGYFNLCALAGGVGTGKTVAAAHFLESAQPKLAFGRAWEPDQRPLFIHASEILVMGLYEHEEERQRLKRARTLVIDDMGAERLDNAGVGLALFDLLINARYSCAGYTLITTNLTWDQFRTRYDERVADRLKQNADWYDLEGASMREVPHL